MLSALFAPAQADAPEPERTFVWLWPCNVAAWNHWVEVQTQWRSGGMGGATGLDYAGVLAYLHQREPKHKKRSHIFDCIRAAEGAVLDVWAKQREDRKRD